MPKGGYIVFFSVGDSGMRLIGDNWSPWEGVEEEIDNGDILDFDEIRKMKDV